MEERFDDSSKQSEAQATVKWIAFLAETGLGGWEMIPKRDTKCNSAKCRVQTQAVFSFLRKDMSASAQCS